MAPDAHVIDNGTPNSTRAVVGRLVESSQDFLNSSPGVQNDPRGADPKKVDGYRFSDEGHGEDARSRSDRLSMFRELSVRLASATEEAWDTTVDGVLESIARHEGVDRAYVVEFRDRGQLIYCTHEWCASGVDAQIDYVQGLSMAAFEWSVRLVNNHEVVYLADLEHAPPEAAAERESFGRYGVQSVLQVPMIAGGEVVGVVGFNSVTRRVAWSGEAIDLVRAVCDGLAAGVIRARTMAELRRARDEAARANEAKTLFLARMSHELRTPLNAVLGFTELLRTDEGRSETDQTALDRVYEAGNRLLGLVDDVLDISRIETDRMEVRQETITVAVQVHSVLSIVGATAPDIKISSSIEPEIIVTADARRLHQVLVNVVSNACKYNRDGGTVEVSVWRERVEGQDEIVVIRVADTGIGIPAADLDRVFEPFDRLGREGSGVEGTGIGMTVTKMLVDRMGGRISIASTCDVGTEVEVRLPAGQRHC